MQTQKEHTKHYINPREKLDPQDSEMKHTIQEAESRSKSENAEKLDEEEEDFWNEAKRNIAEGAKLVGETVGDYSERIMHSLKETAADAYKFSSEFTSEAVQRSQHILDNYRGRKEIKKLSDQRDVWNAKLGLLTYHTVKKHDGHLPENFLGKRDVKKCLKEIEEIDKAILEINPEETEK